MVAIAFIVGYIIIGIIGARFVGHECMEEKKAHPQNYGPGHMSPGWIAFFWGFLLWPFSTVFLVALFIFDICSDLKSKSPFKGKIKRFFLGV